MKHYIILAAFDPSGLATLLVAIGTFLTAIFGAISSFLTARKNDKLMDEQVQQNIKLAAIKEEQARTGKEQGTRAIELDKRTAIIGEKVDAVQRRVEKIPADTQGGYIRPLGMEYTPSRTPTEPWPTHSPREEDEPPPVPPEYLPHKKKK